jgi:hypothetical protein
MCTTTINNIYTPQIIAAGSCQFNIPLYQRLFEWGDEQVEQLLKDLFNAYRKSTAEPYYIGMLTAYVNPKSHAFDLVDGQQRFTVLMLLGIVLRKYGDTANWNKFLSNQNQQLRLSLFARVEDSNYLECLIREETADEKELNPKMNRAIEVMNEYLNKNILGEERSDFSSFVFNHLTFFISQLPSGYDLPDLNRYFETMNSTGRNLEAHEIIKVKLISKINSDKQEVYTAIWNAVAEIHKDVIRNESPVECRHSYLSAIQSGTSLEAWKLCSDYKESGTETVHTEWKKIGEIQGFATKPTGRKDIEYSTYSILSFPEFLLQVLYLSLNKEVANKTDFFDVHKLQETFDSYIFNEKRVQPEKYLDNLLKYRLLFDYYIIQVTYDEASNSSDYDLLFKSGQEDETNKSLLMYESMLYVNSSSATYYQWLPVFLEYLSNINHNQITAKAVLAQLKVIDNANLTLPAYDALCYRAIARYWFWRLDYYLWEQRDLWFADDNKEAVNNYVFRRNRSIEHLHPQNESNNEKWNDAIDSFGNLAMISQSFNSQQNNDEVRIKFARIETHIRNRTLESLKMYRMYLDAKANQDKWTEEQAKKHGEKMFQVLKNSYDVVHPQGKAL